MNWAGGGGNNRAEAPGWEHPTACMVDVRDMGLTGREENAGEVGHGQVVKGSKWLREWSVRKESRWDKVFLIYVNKIKFLPVCL